ncbi:hypothetical protein N1851_006436 [Merluccius polli]|uniref:Reverse transcriptase domain-containing protein n=1 Tax=Merluccius polli TaxID=89951 RepID=A0AA47N4D0_MERPO|nr:hypothetical protein N1851_006436 [Merluccius polli]
MDTAISPQESSSKKRIYLRNQLLALRTIGHSGTDNINHIPKELRRPYRGSRAGAKVKARVLVKRWKFKPSIPLCVMGNVNSFTNKTDELASLVKNVKLYRECSLMCLTETWLNNNIPDASIELTGFSHVRADRDPSWNHNLVFLHPQYTPLVHRQKHTMRSFRKWSPETEEALRDCFDSTDWSVLQESHGEDIEGVTNCTTDYLNFCMDIVVPTRTVCCYLNSKPWITTDVKNLLNRKKQVFKEGDLTEMKRVQGELKVGLREAKELYKKKIEQKMQRNSIREVWEAMKTITGSKRSNGTVDGDVVKANELNHFYNRFDVSTPAAPTVRGQLRGLRPGKAVGPDKVCPRLLKVCATELGEPLQYVFNLSLRLGKVPTMWKTSCLIPVPKKTHPSQLNDFRPVVLTSHMMKTMEQLLLKILRPQVCHALDPLQFAYQEKVGVEDAITYLLHRTHSSGQRERRCENHVF